MGDAQQMKPIRFLTITLSTTVLLVVLAGTCGYYFAADAPGGITISSRSLEHAASPSGEHVDAQVAAQAKRSGVVLGGLLGLVQGAVLGLSIAGVDCYVRSKRQDAQAAE